MPHQVDGQHFLATRWHEGGKGNQLTILIPDQADGGLVDVVRVKEAQGEALFDLLAQPAVGNPFELLHQLVIKRRLDDAKLVAFPVKLVHQSPLRALLLTSQGEVSQGNQTAFPTLDKVKAEFVQQQGKVT